MNIIRAATCLAALLACGVAHAQAPQATAPQATAPQANSCISQTTDATQKADPPTDPKGGKPANHLVPVGTPAAGDEVVYLITVRNTCSTPAANVVIDLPVPAHTTYVKTTAKGDGTNRVFSTDGRAYGRWDSLRVTGADGSQRPVHNTDIKFIRWVFSAPLAPQQSTQLRFHAVQN